MRVAHEIYPNDVSIWAEDCIHNYPGGQCVWAALETMFRHCDMHSADGLAERAMKEGWHGAHDGNIRAFCRKVGVEIEEGHSIADLKRAVEQNTGAVIFIPGHAIYLTGLDDQSARIVDN